MDVAKQPSRVVFSSSVSISWVAAGSAARYRKEPIMTYLKLISSFALISTFAGLTSLLSLGRRETQPRNSRVNAGRSRTAPQSREPGDSPTWPPADGVYWGM
jgi:hypothetical protein